MIVDGSSEVLHKRVDNVSLKKEELVELVQDMLGVMIELKGIGLAANQIGVNQRVALVTDPNTRDVLVLVDPEIVRLGGSVQVRNEGCLSYPNLILPVPRFTQVTVDYQTLSGSNQTIKGTGYLARIIQHEVDHLNGITFIDRNKEYMNERNNL